MDEYLPQTLYSLEKLNEEAKQRQKQRDEIEKQSP